MQVKKISKKLCVETIKKWSRTISLITLVSLSRNQNNSLEY